ncbi:osmotically inducible protein OsmC [Rhodoferax lacus]|uniref:Osmotically inducible protein OsmC n=1 Tax=Rhodoferax lacus TaxID=2184758 RepID=A0A3E1RCY9_9BURK|nr:OsmC family protein [Rhodoferax lacus]RFO97219.1 osmotically inducible protein OsmC [Rhodoferax lacus]
MASLVREAQAALRKLYLENPALALVTDHARSCGPNTADPFHSQVTPMDGCGVWVPMGVHRALGGPHDAPTPGDLLCAALAACQDSALRMVANRLGVVITALEVRVTANVDVRGALGMDAEVPTGFQSMACDVHLAVAEGTPPRLLASLQSAAERCCVVQQTLQHPPPVSTRFHVTGLGVAPAA